MTRLQEAPWLRFLVGTLIALSFAPPARCDATRAEEIRGALREGRFEEAEGIARLGLTQAETTSGTDPVAFAAAEDLLVEALIGNSKQGEDATLAVAQEALAIHLREHPSDPATAGSLENMASLLERRGESLAATKSMHERALEIRERALGPDHLDVATSLMRLAWCLRESDAHASARPLYERALAIRQARLGAWDPAVAEVLVEKSTLERYVSNLLRAQSLLEQALAIQLRAYGPEAPAVASSQRLLANVLADIGDFPAARSLYEEALATQLKLGPDRPLVAITLNAFGSFLADTGDAVRAREYFERSLEIFRIRRIENANTARTLFNLAESADRNGDYARAETYYERARRIFERQFGGNFHSVAWCLGGVAGLRTNRGDYAAAEGLYRRSLQILEDGLGPEHPDVGQALLGLASVLEAKGDVPGALAAAVRAHAIFERKLGPGHPFVASALDTMGRLRASVGDDRGAGPLVLRALAIRTEALGASHPLVAASLIHVAAHHWATGQTPLALRESVEAEAIVREHLQRTARTLSEREALRHEGTRQSGLNLGFSILTSGEPRPATARRMWDALVRSRALVLDEMAERHRSVLESGDARIAATARGLESARGRLSQLVIAGAGGDRLEDYRTHVLTAQEDVDAAERLLGTKSLEFRRNRDRRRIGLAEVLRALPPDGALVAYVQYERLPRRPIDAEDREHPRPRLGSGYLALAASPGGTLHAVELGSVVEIDALVRGWKAQASALPSDPDAEARYREAGDRLRNAIWEPVAPFVAPARRVFVVPDGNLHLVTLETLPTGEDRYLVQDGPEILYLSAERDLVPAGAGDVSGQGLLLVGGADFDAAPLARANPGGPGEVATVAYRGPSSICGDFRSLRFSSLPSSLAEVEEVESLWQERTRSPAEQRAITKLVGAGADEAAFKESARGRRVIHVATHGFFMDGACGSALTRPGTHRDGRGLVDRTGENPLLLSGLAFAGANRRDEAGDAEDGILTAEEIASLDLRGVQWVVLSACETGLGPLQSGEGVLGLRRAFEVAGAETLIMSLWPVADHDAREWIRGLYEGRLAGLSTAAAVRHASLGILEARRRARAPTHPFFWGAFVAAGVDR